VTVRRLLASLLRRATGTLASAAAHAGVRRHMASERHTTARTSRVLQSVSATFASCWPAAHGCAGPRSGVSPPALARRQRVARDQSARPADGTRARSAPGAAIAAVIVGLRRCGCGGGAPLWRRRRRQRRHAFWARALPLRCALEAPVLPRSAMASAAAKTT